MRLDQFLGRNLSSQWRIGLAAAGASAGALAALWLLKRRQKQPGRLRGVTVTSSPSRIVKVRRPAEITDPDWLPDELWAHILSFLPNADFWRCGAVCKSWHTVTRDAEPWMARGNTTTDSPQLSDVPSNYVPYAILVRVYRSLEFLRRMYRELRNGNYGSWRVVVELGMGVAFALAVRRFISPSFSHFVRPFLFGCAVALTDSVMRHPFFRRPYVERYGTVSLAVVACAGLASHIQRKGNANTPWLDLVGLLLIRSQWMIRALLPDVCMSIQNAMVKTRVRIGAVVGTTVIACGTGWWFGYWRIPVGVVLTFAEWFVLLMQMGPRWHDEADYAENRLYNEQYQCMFPAQVLIHRLWMAVVFKAPVGHCLAPYLGCYLTQNVMYCPLRTFYIPSLMWFGVLSTTVRGWSLAALFVPMYLVRIVNSQFLTPPHLWRWTRSSAYTTMMIDEKVDVMIRVQRFWAGIRVAWIRMGASAFASFQTKTSGAGLLLAEHASQGKPKPSAVDPAMVSVARFALPASAGPSARVMGSYRRERFVLSDDTIVMIDYNTTVMSKMSGLEMANIDNCGFLDKSVLVGVAQAELENHLVYSKWDGSQSHIILVNLDQAQVVNGYTMPVRVTALACWSVYVVMCFEQHKKNIADGPAATFFRIENNGFELEVNVMESMKPCAVALHALHVLWVGKRGTKRGVNKRCVLYCAYFESINGRKERLDADLEVLQLPEDYPKDAGCCVDRWTVTMPYCDHPLVGATDRLGLYCTEDTTYGLGLDEGAILWKLSLKRCGPKEMSSLDTPLFQVHGNIFAVLGMGRLFVCEASSGELLCVIPVQRDAGLSLMCNGLVIASYPSKGRNAPHVEVMELKAV